jgi:hypothetical protein
MTKITLNLKNLVKDALAGETSLVHATVDAMDLFELNDIEECEADVEELLRRNGMIAKTWSVDDVRRCRQDLDRAQIWSVLEEMRRRIALGYGLAEELLEQTAHDLFGTSNSQRVERCEKALAVYDEPELIDLLAYAMHWCRAKGRGFNAALASAQAHFDAETSEE